VARKFLNGVDLSNQRLINLADGSAATDAVTLQQLQAAIRGLDWKPSVRVASTANLNTASPGATIDGVTMAANDRVLLKDQTTGSQNGIYVWNGAAVAMTRATDADSSAEVTSGMAVTVAEGTVNGDKVFVLTTNDPITLATTALVFTLLGGGSGSYTAGNGLQLSGSTFSVVPGAGIIADGTSTRIDPSVVSRKFASNVGNGSLTSIAVVHNLGTRDVIVAIYDSATFEEVDCDIVRTDANTVTLGFATAPASGAYRCVVQG